MLQRHCYYKETGSINMYFFESFLNKIENEPQSTKMVNVYNKFKPTCIVILEEKSSFPLHHLYSLEAGIFIKHYFILVVPTEKAIPRVITLNNTYLALNVTFGEVLPEPRCRLFLNVSMLIRHKNECISVNAVHYL